MRFIFSVFVLTNIAALFVPLHSNAESTVHYKVVRVKDGDTVVLEKVGTVRLIGVDTPETVHPKTPVEYYGKEASSFLRTLIEGKLVRVDYDWQRKDKYGRTLAYLYLENGTFINAEIIKRGFGQAYTVFPFKLLTEFREYEKAARNSKVGLWADHEGEKDPKPLSIKSSPEAAATSWKFSCGSKRKCGDMGSCDEAKFYLKTCGISRLDGDHDGIPCESLCGN